MLAGEISTAHTETTQTKTGGPSRLSCVLLASFAVLTASGIPMTETVCFVNDTSPDGWTLSNGEWTSPQYPYPVSEISFSCSAQSSSGFTEVSASSGGDVWTPLASLRAASTGATLRLSEGTGLRSFRVAPSEAELMSFSATWTDPRLPAPQNISAVAFSEDTVEVSWDPIANAESYRITVWTNATVGASGGNEVWCDGFSNAEAGSTSASAIDTEAFNSSYADIEGWECGTYVYPSTNAGAVRIGGSEKSRAGSLLTPPLAAGDWHLRLRAWRYSASDGNMMPVLRVSGGETSLVCVASFSLDAAEPEELTLRLPRLNDGDRLLLCSFTNRSPRVVIDRISLLSGYSAGESVPVTVAEIPAAATARSCIIQNLPHGAVVFVGVSAIDADGLQGVQSTGAETDLSNPPPRAVLNAVPISSLSDFAYSQDFEEFSDADTKWLNGTTLPFWQAFKVTDDTAEPVEKLSKTDGKAQAGGIYRLASNSYTNGYAFGACAAAGNGYVWGIAFSNDTPYKVSLTNLSFRAAQWGFGNTTSQCIRLSVIVTNELVNIASGGAWSEFSNLQFDAPFSDGDVHDAPHGGEVPLSSAVDDAEIPPGSVLLLKWSFIRPAGQSGRSAVLGIDDVCALFSKRGRGFVISLASAAAD